MRYLLAVLLLTLPAFASDTLVFKGDKAVNLDSPTATVEFTAEHFAGRAGRIEFDFKLTKPLAPDKVIWCLFSDIGAAGSHWGAINVHWRDEQGKLEYAIFDGANHHWCYSKTTEWEVGRWYHLGLVYGPGGMRLEIDGKLQDSNSYSGGLANTAKKLGFYDGYNESPPVIIDNLRTYRTGTYGLDLSEPVLSPNGDGLFEDCTITYEVADDADVTLDVLKDGKLVKRLIAHQQTPAGEHSLVWDGKGLADGEYTISLIARSASTSRKLDAGIRIDRRWKWGKPKPAFTKFFPLGTWYFWEDDATYIGRRTDDQAKVNDYYMRTMKDLGDHGFNLIFPVWTPKDHRHVMLDEANRNGIKAILHLDEINAVIGKGEAGDKEDLFEVASNEIEDFKDHPAVAGYYMIDEPSNAPDVARRIARARRVLEAIDPKHPGFSCLLGGYEDLLKTVDYRVLLIDIYPLYPNWSGDWSGYIAQLERGQKNAGERPLWVILQAFGKPNNAWKIPTPEEIRAQVWLALAHGAKGIVYFIYQSTTGFQGEWLQGMVDMDLKPMDSRLDEVGRINADITKLAPTLLKLKPAVVKLPDVPESVIAKGFTDGKSRYVILANKDTKSSATIAVQGIDVLTGSAPPSTLPPGGGVVLKL